MTLAHCLVPCPYCPTARLPTPPWLLIGVKLVLPPVEAESMRLCDYTANLTDCFGSRLCENADRGVGSDFALHFRRP